MTTHNITISTDDYTTEELIELLKRILPIAKDKFEVEENIKPKIK